ncbi:hypothetical protein P3T23_008959 [Paraburkholderia sp. GAS448]
MRILTNFVAQALFDRGGLKAVFEHVRNLVSREENIRPRATHHSGSQSDGLERIA